MNNGTTSVDEARRALGKRLRELCTSAGISGKQLAESLSWPASKVSKIQNGKQTPTDDDIRAWTQATGAEHETAGLLAALHTLELQHAEWSRLLKAGMKAHQTSLAQQDEKIKLYRGFESAVIPGLLQTPDYARARFAQVVTMHRVPNDIDDAVRARMQRQEMLYRQDKRFHFILTEAVLRYRLVPPDVMLAQLDRLIALSAMRNVRLGIIAFETQYIVDPRHGFWLLDNDLVRFESYTGEENRRHPDEIEYFAGVFERHAAVASYGAAARAIITRVVEDLRPDTPEDGDVEF
jgi:transcriptional regulator with XRE-family HTH domain